MDGTTYYAKFDYNFAPMTIRKTYNGISAAEAEKLTAVFHVSGTDGRTMDVAIVGNGSATIEGCLIGSTYTVTEDANWSWRYSTSCDKANGQLTIAVNGNVITFTNTVTDNHWLTDSTNAVNLPKVDSVNTDALVPEPFGTREEYEEE